MFKSRFFLGVMCLLSWKVVSAHPLALHQSSVALFDTLEPIIGCHELFERSDLYRDEMECYQFTAPKDYQQPDGELVHLFFSLHRARHPQHKIGTLWVNFGGPGLSSSGLLLDFLEGLPQELIDQFDIIGLDPRGTGYSSFSEEFNVCTGHKLKPNSVQCDANQFDFTSFMGTQTLVKDMDRLRQILGAEKINFIGYSYGTLAGALYLKQYPEHSRAFVFDSPMSPFSTNSLEIKHMMQTTLKRNTEYVLSQICKMRLHDQLCNLFIDLNNDEQFSETYRNAVVAYYHYPLVIRDFLSFVLSYQDSVTLDQDTYAVEQDASISFKDQEVFWKQFAYDLITRVLYLPNIDIRQPDQKEWAIHLFVMFYWFNEHIERTQMEVFIRLVIETLDTYEDIYQSGYQLNTAQDAILCTDQWMTKPLPDSVSWSLPKWDIFDVNKLGSLLCQDWSNVADPVSDIGSKHPVLIIGNEYDFATPSFWYKQMKSVFPQGYYLWIQESIEHSYIFKGRHITDLFQVAPPASLDQFDLVDQYVTDYLLHLDRGKMKYLEGMQGQEMSFSYQLPASLAFDKKTFFKKLGDIWQGKLSVMQDTAFHE